MSADNGIYILETDGPEFRVSHLQNIEDYAWQSIPTKEQSYDGHHTDDPDIHIKNARRMWEKCEVFTDKTKALIEAGRQYDEIMNSDFPICEYGISFIKIPRKF